jgi:hypothetical protein
MPVPDHLQARRHMVYQVSCLLETSSGLQARHRIVASLLIGQHFASTIALLASTTRRFVQIDDSRPRLRSARTSCRTSPASTTCARMAGTGRSGGTTDTRTTTTATPHPRLRVGGDIQRREEDCAEVIRSSARSRRCRIGRECAGAEAVGLKRFLKERSRVITQGRSEAIRS